MERWLSKGRSIYLLTNAINDVLGIAWYGQEKPEVEAIDSSQFTRTCAYRLFCSARGKGLAELFIQDSMTLDRAFLSAVGLYEQYHLETFANNFPARKSYTRVGFREVARIPQDPIPPNRQRSYMVLG